MVKAVLSKKRGSGRGAGACKVPKRSDPLLPSSGVLDRLWSRHTKEMYGPALPFEIHTSNGATPIRTRADDDDSTEDWDLTRFDYPPRAWVDIAKSALNAGLRLSFDVPRALSCNLAAMFACRLGDDVCAAYDVVRKRLVLWHSNEEVLRDAITDDLGERGGKAVV